MDIYKKLLEGFLPSRDSKLAAVD